jgi:hypothetical protein
MRLLPLAALGGALATWIEAAPPIALADQPSAKLTHDIAALFKDPGGVRIADVAVYDGGATRQAVCGNVSVRNGDGSYTGVQPFRILTRPGGGIADPLSFLVGTDSLTVRRVVPMCSSDRNNDQH